MIWFGLRSFWGHLWHFVASAIATEDIDSRDWMSPDDPKRLLERVADVLGAEGTGQSLVERLGRDLWIDYVADTGDDVEVSRKVAALIFSDYEVPDPDAPDRSLSAPRGDILMFGGDTAYPVATGEEINNRVVVPFNQVLGGLQDAAPRVLMGIPGNHDWYDGLDGFARLFRRRFERDDDDEDLRPSLVHISRNPLEHYADFAREFMRGGQIGKPKALVFDGYVPVQQASYFALPLTREIHLLAVDRQLKALDYRQRHYFADWRMQHTGLRPWIMLPDPVYAFSKPNLKGMTMIDNLGLDIEHQPHFILSGDIHHYQRQQVGASLHVIAGGGGAFLHPAAMRVPEAERPNVQWPGPRQSRRLLWHVPWKVASGRSGILPHLILLLLFVPLFNMDIGLARIVGEASAFPVSVFLVTLPIYALIGGSNRGRKVVWLWAALAAALTALIPQLALTAMHLLLSEFGFLWPRWLIAGLTMAISVGVGAFVFGAYLAFLTLRGLEETQAFTALNHPGYKHFLRLRVRADGSAIDGFCLGLEDPLGDSQPQLVDSFTWRTGR